jgi:hypothetical protein
MSTAANIVAWIYLIFYIPMTILTIVFVRLAHGNRHELKDRLAPRDFGRVAFMVFGDCIGIVLALLVVAS